MKKNSPQETEANEVIRKPSRLPGLALGVVQFFILAGVVFGLGLGGFFLFRGTLLERYFEKQTGYPCSVEKFDFDPRGSMMELRNLVIHNIEPYPDIPLAKVRRLRMEWDPKESKRFPKRLKLLELELDELTLVRLDGNKFNVLDFVEAIIQAWGTSSSEAGANGGESDLLIDECWLLWDYLVALDEEDSGGKRMEVLVEYEGYHQDVNRIREITDPAIKIAKNEVDGFYFFNYLNDSLQSLLKK